MDGWSNGVMERLLEPESWNLAFPTLNTPLLQNHQKCLEAEQLKFDPAYRTNFPGLQ